MHDFTNQLAQAADLAVQGRYPEARTIHHALLQSAPSAEFRSRIENDLAAMAAVQGHDWSSRLHLSRAVKSSNGKEVCKHNVSLLGSARPSEGSAVKVAILSLLFNWPSTGGAVRTKELAEFLTRDGYDVRHIYAVNASFGVGCVTEPLGHAGFPLEFSDDEWNAECIRRRFQAAVREFDPDWVLITDSWNTKPLLAEASVGYPYLLRIEALESLCPLNNVRMLFAPEEESSGCPKTIQCELNQLAEPQACRDCVLQNADLSGGLHKAERVLAGFHDDEYPHRLRQAFAEAEGVLAVNPRIASLVEPHTPAVHVIPSGFDPLRFPVEYQPPPADEERRTRILFAGLRDELMQGFHVLESAAARLWDRRQDFELWVTGELREGDPEYFKGVGGQSPQQLTALMCATDLLVFPTVAQEAWGRSAVEAMGCGRPVVAGRIGGLDGVVEHERTGLLFEPGDAGDLVRQLERLLGDPGLREQLGRAGREKFRNEFTWESILERGYRPLFGSAGKAEWSQFGIGNFADDDDCRRARPFKGAGADLAGMLRENRQKYREQRRTSETVPAAKRPPDQPPLLGKARPPYVLDSEPDGLRLQPNSVKLSACLIVRDNEETIRPCLESVKPWVDEIVVVDTGSSDRTRDICRELGARVFDWPWRDSFAAARNESLDHARGEWIFWLDSDDTLPEQCGRRLQELVNGEQRSNVLGYVVQVHCPGTTADDLVVVDHVKLFANRPDLRFEFRIHEQIIPSIRRAGGDVDWSDLFVVHSGSDRTAQGRARKLERDFHLLELELADRPEHPFVLFNLGMTHADARQYEPAIDHLQRCIRVSEPDESHVRKAFALLVSSLCRAGRYEQGWDAAAEGLQRFPDDKELLFRQAMLNHDFGRLKEAERLYLRILTEQTERHFISVDAGIAGYKTRHNLAIVYEEMNRPEEAVRQWRIILEELPGYIPAWCRLCDLLTERGRLEELAQLCQQISAIDEFPDVVLYLQGKIALAHGAYDLARKNFEEAAKFADDRAYVSKEGFTNTLSGELCRLRSGTALDQ